MGRRRPRDAHGKPDRKGERVAFNPRLDEKSVYRAGNVGIAVITTVV